MTVETEYANTDLDLKSATAFDALNRELQQSCSVVHYTRGDDGCWHSIVESSESAEEQDRHATKDIVAMLNAVQRLSPIARAEFDACSLREFNIGLNCWDTWSYVHALPTEVVRAVADAGCSIAVTLYPMRNPDGTAKE
ncbi:MAG: hypothetical protein C0483_00765 [Pirellula sp.]|nr:hypothetical protein [Pirellula sp.]